MVITTNVLDPKELCEQIHERTVSRLTEMCDEIPLIGEDRRVERDWQPTEPSPAGEFARRF